MGVRGEKRDTVFGGGRRKKLLRSWMINVVCLRPNKWPAQIRRPRNVSVFSPSAADFCSPDLGF